MLILTVNLRVPLSEQDALRPAMEAIVKAARQEAGCIHFTFAFDLLEPDIIRAFEIYADDEALKAHGASDHFKAWRAVSGHYPREERTIYDVTRRD